MGESSDGDLEASEECIYTWQVGILCAVIVFIVFLFFHIPLVSCFMIREIPDATMRTISLGLILAAVTFLVVGVFHYCMVPIQDNREQEPTYKCLEGIIV